MAPQNKLPPRPIKPNSKSYDDLAAVSAMDAAEARLRAAMHLAEDEAKRANEEERKNEELRSVLDTMTMKAVQPPAPIQVTASIIPAAPDGKPISVSPQALTFRGKHWKFTIPFTLIISLLPLIWALVSDYMQMKRDFKTQTDTFARITARVEEVNAYAHDVGKSNYELRETVAQLSGYLSGVLPKAGVKVPAVEPGAAYINVVSDPLPLAEMKKRQKSIIVHTPVPAPK
jgi:hypothetical protein